MNKDKLKMSEEEVLLFEMMKEKLFEEADLNEDETNIFIMLKEKIQLHYEPLCKTLKKQAKLPFFILYKDAHDLHAVIYNRTPNEDIPYEKGLVLLNRCQSQSDLMVPIDVLFMTEKELSKTKFNFIAPYSRILVYDFDTSVRRRA